MVRRKDNKGKVLQKGETQRSDGLYVYRWTDCKGKRRSLYARTLNELRSKEAEQEKKDLAKGEAMYRGDITVGELAEICCGAKRVKITTEKKRAFLLGVVNKTGFGLYEVADVRTSIAKKYLVALSEEYCYHYGTISAIKSFLHGVFQVAVEDDVILKNPFEFRLEYLIYDDRKKRTALSVEQSELVLRAFKEDKWYQHAYVDVLVLLRTGLRVSELYGLTFKDVDFANNRIHVNKQLHWMDGRYVLMSTKSKAGNRTLAMTDEVRTAFLQKAREKRPKKELMVDGHTGFIFLNQNNVPKTRKNLAGSMTNIQKKHPELSSTPKLTPHLLRHTFCTRMVEAKVEAKVLQVIMGHSDISTTLDVYTHLDENMVVNEMQKALQFTTPISPPVTTPILHQNGRKYSVL